MVPMFLDSKKQAGQNSVKILITLSFISAIFISTHGATSRTDTIQPAKHYKISQQQFLDKYGRDDTAKIIINYYFLRHKKATKKLIPYSLVIAGSGVLYATSVVNRAAGVELIWGSLTIGAMVFFGVFLLSCWNDLYDFSRKKLLKTLGNYFSGKGIPSRLKKNLYKKEKWY